MQNKASIYSNHNPQLTRLFEDAGSSKKILCAALDYAKSKHCVLFCNGLGDILKKAFAVPNSVAGVQSLTEHLEKSCHHHGIKKKHVFLGGEDIPSYAENFMGQVRQRGYLVVRANAWEAKRQRDNFQASTDSLDLLGIAKVLLSLRAQTMDCSQTAYHQMREISRCRRRLVDAQTTLKNRAHTYVDRLFPGFLNPRISPVAPFSRASLALMREHFSAAQIARKKLSSLAHTLQKHGQSQAQASAEELQALAREALCCLPDQQPSWQSSLGAHVELLQSFGTNIAAVHREVAFWLAQTPGAMLTTISGIGVILAGGLTGELGDLCSRPLGRLCSYNGIIPSVQQTGGPDKPPQAGPVRRRCNTIAKNWLIQCVSEIALLGPEELKIQYQKLVEEKKHADFVMARRLLRICKDLVGRQAAYLPKVLLRGDSLPEQRAAHYLHLWPKLLAKWKNWADLQHVFAPAHPLGRWREMVQEAYKISLPLGAPVAPEQEP